MSKNLLSLLGLERAPVSLVEQELARLRRGIRAGSPVLSEPVEERYQRYLEFAQSFGLGGEEVVWSCRDLALTLDQRWKGFESPKTAVWRKIRDEALVKSRPPRMIEMQLYPEYFAAIYRKAKSFEGRAYDPASPKDYPDIRKGDSIVFSVSREVVDWDVRCRTLGLDPQVPMVVEVGRVEFAPLVHWMYQLPGVEGENFQPTISGVSELINLQRAAVYYTFPGYAQKITDHGFVGIEVTNPRLIGS